MSVLRYGVVILALLAIAWPAAPPKALPGLAGSEWRVVEIGGAKASGGGTVRFTSTSIRGKSGCNAFFGAFRESHGRIEIAGLNETPMLCQSGLGQSVLGKGVLALERALLDGLARVAAYRLDGRMLVLLDIEGKAIARLAG